MFVEINMFTGAGKIVKYFRKRRGLYYFQNTCYDTVTFNFFDNNIIFIIYPQSVVSGEIDASVNEVGELTIKIGKLTNQLKKVLY